MELVIFFAALALMAMLARVAADAGRAAGVPGPIVGALKHIAIFG